MRLIDGLHATRIRRLKGLRGNGLSQTSLFAETVDALAWVPGSEGYEMWAAHTEALLHQMHMERLSRGDKIVV